MATIAGDFVRFNARAGYWSGGVRNWSGGDVYNFAFIRNTPTAITIATPDPHWNGTGATDLSLQQVITTGTVYTGPFSVTPSQDPRTNGDCARTIGATDVDLAQDMTGFNDANLGVIFNVTDPAQKAVYLFIASGIMDLTVDSIQIVPNTANGILLEVA